MNIKRWIKDPFPALSHWLGAGLSIAALVLLLVYGHSSAWHAVGFAIYGGCMIFLYTSSALAHSIHCSDKAASRLDRLDYAAIFLLIAGTYTPICLVTLRGPWGWSILGTEWILALLGIAFVMRKSCPTWLRLTLYIGMGWVCIIAIEPVLSHMPLAGLLWLAAGGLAYTLGAVVFALDRPHLWPGKFAAHDLWHVMVLVGSACHFVVMLAFVANAS
jgi:hemolysin III